MRLSKSKSADSKTRERLFTEKYDWLLGRARHLSNGDSARAEDLVHDAFVRFVLAETVLKSAENIEPLLYTYLKFAHLSYLRRLQRYPSEPLPLAKYDFLELALRANGSLAERVEVQNTLRRIVAYLCWRKDSAKSASLLILRYFHAYYSEEIARIAQAAPSNIRKQLHEAREEVSLYVSSPGRLRIIRQPEPSELNAPYSPVASDQLIPELRKTIFAVRQSECLTEDALRKHYQKKTLMSRDLLSHIVSCERCLNLVNRICGIAPPTDRYLDEVLGHEDQSPAKDQKADSKSGGAKRALQIVRERFREIYEHEPSQLNLVVNGSVLATHDVSSTWNRLEVKLGADVVPEFIEVISEQDVCLLAMRVDCAADEVRQEIHSEIDLSYGRQVRARIRFTTVGVLVQVTYYAPEEALAPEVEFDPDLSEDAKSSECSPRSQVAENDSDPFFLPWLSSVWAKIPRLRLAEMSPALAAAGILAILFIVAGGYWLKGRLVVAPDQLLTRAVIASNAQAKSAASGVVCQKVRIHTNKRAFERVIHRDTKDARQPKPQTLSPEDVQLKSLLTIANVSWDDPLSVVSFKLWRAEGHIVHDEVTHSGSGLVTVTTELSGGDVASESLTLREQDLHPIERTVNFRNAETVEIAELDYNILPWSKETNALFAPSMDGVPETAKVSGSMPILPLDESSLDEAELKSRLVLAQLRQDLDDRLQVVRSGEGIEVRGLVATQIQKQQLENRLHSVPHVRCALSTFEDMTFAQGGKKERGGIIADAQDSEQSVLDVYLINNGWTVEKSNELSWQLLDASLALRGEGAMVKELHDRFGREEHLSDEARHTLAQLMMLYNRRLLADLQHESASINQIIPDEAITNYAPQQHMSLTDSILSNQRICATLASGNDKRKDSYSVEQSMRELRASIIQIQSAAHSLVVEQSNTFGFAGIR